ncbi:MAG: hypothetical protein RL509_418, partial [Pseudomonadota bacterium]
AAGGFSVEGFAALPLNGQDTTLSGGAANLVAPVRQ